MVKIPFKNSWILTGSPS